MASNECDMASDLMLVPEAALFLRLRPSTIRAWILSRRIPYLKLGGRVCLRRADLEALLERSLIPATSNKRDGFKSAGSSPPSPADNRKDPAARPNGGTP
jgi:excisionase family DNA binding protein